MDEAEQARRTWVLTIGRFAEMAWARHGATRYASVATVPLIVAFAVPGWWWFMCAVFTGAAMMIDRRAHRFFERVVPNLDQYDIAELQGLVRRQIAALSAITTLYAVPYALLAFAPPAGPVLGVVFCAGAAVVCATLHVMTRTMIFRTIPAIAVGLAANAAALAGGGAMSLLAAALGFLVAINAVVAARGGAASFGDLISARLKAEEAAAELERRVEERTAQLAVATRRAEAANRAKSLFLANMSHELRTPLNAVIGYSEIIEEDLDSGDTERSAADLAKIRHAASHLLAMINEVLDLSRIEAGKLDLRPTEFDVSVLLRNALDTVRPTASKNRSICQLNVAPGIGVIHADETRLRQCVLNLLSNAAKFTEGGVVALDARVCRIGSAEGVAISVRDTGPGISAEQLARLFQPFVQADASHTRAHDGAGLGLVITRRLARAMGGDVQASSKLGQGSTFTLYLPTNARIARAA